MMQELPSEDVEKRFLMCAAQTCFRGVKKTAAALANVSCMLVGNVIPLVVVVSVGTPIALAASFLATGASVCASSLVVWKSSSARPFYKRAIRNFGLGLAISSCVSAGGLGLLDFVCGDYAKFQAQNAVMQDFEEKLVVPESGKRFFGLISGNPEVEEVMGLVSYKQKYGVVDCVLNRPSFIFRDSTTTSKFAFSLPAPQGPKI